MSSAAGPDVSARVAWADDAPAIAAVQVRAWRESYAALLPAEVLEALDVDDAARTWRNSLARPEDARQRVIVALERNTVTGFVITSPATDPDCDPVSTGEVSELTVDPHRRGHGHGSRLLKAAADTLVNDRFVGAVAWLPATDESRRAFLEQAGFGPDGAHRTLDLTGDGSTTLTEVRLRTRLADEGAGFTA